MVKATTANSSVVMVAGSVVWLGLALIAVAASGCGGGAGDPAEGDTPSTLDADPGDPGDVASPGVEPPGVEPPGAELPGAEPPGAEPPGAEPPDADASAADVSVAGQDAASDRDDGPQPNARPAILSFTIPPLPATPGDRIPLRLVVADPDGDSISLAVDVSTDDGLTWRPARLDASPPAVVASPEGTTVLLFWDSVRDVGFHTARAARLRATATDGGGPGTSVGVTLPVIDNLRAALGRVDHYMVSYGTWNAASIAIAKRHQLVIIHPDRESVTRQTVAEIQAGLDPNDPADDVIVLGYVSVGEDPRAAHISDAAARSDPRFAGDGSGPRIDPRGFAGSGGSLEGIDPRGLPSTGGTGFASYYLDDNSVHFRADHKGDGLPDRNAKFGGLFVNAGDPAWFDVIDGMTIDGADQLPGLREVLTTTTGRGLGCDGVFLDTIDTAAPNGFTNITSSNPSKFEWTAPGFSTFVRRVHNTYPARLVLQNRGMFFFDPRHAQYRFTTRGSIDIAFFESYRLNSNASETFNPFSYADDRYNIAPKLMSEANRPDGFKVLSLGYAAGPGIDPETLVGRSTVGLDTLLEDIHVTQELAGFRHYISNSAVNLDNAFVLDRPWPADSAPPVWTSTFNDNYRGYPVPSEAATPRIGIQQAQSVAAGITVRWDVALDLHSVGYALYTSQTPFDFTGDPDLHKAIRTVLTPVVSAAYRTGVGPGIYPYEALVRDLSPGQKYYLAIRAFDKAFKDGPAANEEKNRVVLAATAGP